MSGLIAVHVGAGYHAENRRKSYKDVCKSACRVAAELLKKKTPAVDVVSEAVAVLEDCHLTNAGVGSNLTLDGRVECDAGIMDGENLCFGSVGALYSIQNPVKVAHAILKAQVNGLLRFGRIPPCTLVGEGALQWANDHGFSCIDASKLITKSASKTHSRYSILLNSSHPPENTLVAESKFGGSCEERLDTVGALCVDIFGNVSSAVSSGGIVLKYPGRIGQAAVYGAGCWAQNGASENKPNIAVSVTGTGEYLIKTLFARECYDGLLQTQHSLTSLSSVFRNRFLESPFLKNIGPKSAGALTVTYFPDENVSELSWAHSTKTFLLGYMSAFENKPHCVISEQPPGVLPGLSVVGSGKIVASSVDMS